MGAIEIYSSLMARVSAQGIFRAVLPRMVSFQQERQQCGHDKLFTDMQFALAARPLVDVPDGIDIPQAMLEQAQKLGIYRELIHADTGSCLKTAKGAVDLVVASSAAVCVTG